MNKDRRITTVAIVKSLIEAGREVTREVVEAHLDIIDEIAPDTSPVAPAVTPPGRGGAGAPPATSSPGGGSTRLSVVNVEERGSMVKVEATGYDGGRYFTAFDANATTARTLAPGDTFDAIIVEKPNKNGGRPYLNLTAIAKGEDIPF